LEKWFDEIIAFGKLELTNLRITTEATNQIAQAVVAKISQITQSTEGIRRQLL
jgi:hypothetical protein